MPASNTAISVKQEGQRFISLLGKTDGLREIDTEMFYKLLVRVDGNKYVMALLLPSVD